jgi:2-(1,2-epoxy-1,2-dihydrophenyl)acetyl-CoA isomerase
MTETAARPPLRIALEGGVKTLTLQRPETRNALDRPLMLALREALEASADDETRCVLIHGEGGHFSSGADLKAAARDGFDPDSAFALLTDVFAPTLRAVRACPVPVIAAVEGYAAGLGCDLALACDVRLASTRARFAELFVRIGLIPDGGGTWLLPRIVGLGRALDLIFTGADVDGETAAAIGLAARVFPADAFMDEAHSYARTLAAQAPGALRRAKAAVYAALEGGYEHALAREAAHQRAILGTHDGQEGFTAFLEKRPPRWTGT